VGFCLSQLSSSPLVPKAVICKRPAAPASQFHVPVVADILQGHCRVLSVSELFPSNEMPSCGLRACNNSNVDSVCSLEHLCNTGERTSCVVVTVACLGLPLDCEWAAPHDFAAPEVVHVFAVVCRLALLALEARQNAAGRALPPGTPSVSECPRWVTSMDGRLFPGFNGHRTLSKVTVLGTFGGGFSYPGSPAWCSTSALRLVAAL